MTHTSTKPRRFWIDARSRSLLRPVDYIDDRPSESAIRTMHLVSANPSVLTIRGGERLRAGLREALENGWVCEAPRRAIAYALTREGREILRALEG